MGRFGRMGKKIPGKWSKQRARGMTQLGSTQSPSVWLDQRVWEMKCLFEKMCRVEPGANTGCQATAFGLCPSSRETTYIFDERTEELKGSPEGGERFRGENRF